MEARQQMTPSQKREELKSFLEVGDCDFAIDWVKTQEIQSLEEVQALTEVSLIDLHRLSAWKVGHCLRFLSHCRQCDPKCDSKEEAKQAEQQQQHFVVFMDVEAVALKKGDKVTLSPSDGRFVVRRPNGQFLGYVPKDQARVIPQLVGLLLDVTEIGEVYGSIRIVSVRPLSGPTDGAAS